MDPVYYILWRSLAIFLLFGAVCGVLLGGMLIIRPSFWEGINQAANRWISTRRFSQLLDTGFRVESWCYRHHRALGIVIVLGALYTLYYFGLSFHRHEIMVSLSQYLPGKLLDGLLDALVLGMLSGAVVALGGGLFLLLRPSMLRGMELQANQWVSSRRATRGLEIPRDQVERFVMRYASPVGWLLLLASLYLLITLLGILM